MDKCIKDFEGRMKEAVEHIEGGIEEFEEEMDGALYQFMVKGNGAFGKHRTERAIRRLRKMYEKWTKDIKIGKKKMLERMNSIERERKMKIQQEEDQKLGIAIGGEKAETEQKRKPMTDEVEKEAEKLRLEAKELEDSFLSEDAEEMEGPLLSGDEEIATAEKSEN